MRSQPCADRGSQHPDRVSQAERKRSDPVRHPAHLVYSNPMKRRSDIEHAYGLGVRLFVADSFDELAKLSAATPGSAPRLPAEVDLTAAGDIKPTPGSSQRRHQHWMGREP
jgi:diaminopimelate decarboxylase